MTAVPAPSAHGHSAAASVLAFDFGTRRIGIAVGAPMLGSARPLTTIAAEDNATRFSAIAKLIVEWQPGTLVVGLPLDLEGREHDMTRRCRRFAHQLESRFGLPVAFVDERLSSIDAESRLAARGQPWQKRKQAIDAEAAATILQDYFSQRDAKDI